jgi:hypothetical protein
MFRLCLPLLLGLAVVTSSDAQEYGVSLSASATDPAINHVPSLGSEEFFVYLWLTCATGSGANAFEGIVTSTYAVTDFEALSGLLGSPSTPDHPFIKLEDCPLPPLLIGRWQLTNETEATSGSVCLEFPWWEGPTCAVVDCMTLGGVQDAAAGVFGFAVGDSTACSASNGCEEE